MGSRFRDAHRVPMVEAPWVEGPLAVQAPLLEPFLIGDMGSKKWAPRDIFWRIWG